MSKQKTKSSAKKKDLRLQELAKSKENMPSKTIF
jgi:hypothetical protein